MIAENLDFDVAIIGGGPGGSTTAAYLRKYAPHLRVAVIEREEFPRDHVGESQLPPIGRVLHEIGAWDKIEAANFP
ncbi:MAG: FAD-dependent oxidoreductase, partial [Planctomycetota bacterium]